MSHELSSASVSAFCGGCGRPSDHVARRLDTGLPDTAGARDRAVRARRPARYGRAPDRAAKLSESLGKQFYVENLPGGSGNTGTGQAARATADGYTVLITVNNIVINPPLFEKVPYDPYKDFDPVSLAVSYSSVLAVNPAVPAKTVKELVDLIKANPGKYSYASPGFGTPTHLLGEQLRVALGLDLVHVPYTGSGPATAAIVAGHAPIGFVGLAAAGQFARDGKLRLLAVMSRNPSSALAGRPHHRGRRLPGPRRRRLGRRAGAGRHPEGDRCPAQCGDRQGRQGAGAEGTAGDSSASIRSPARPRRSRSSFAPKKRNGRR